MAISEVRNYLKSYDIDDKILELNVSSATVELAAQALNCEPQRIAKTLSFLLDDRAVLVVCAGDVKIDNSKFKTKFKTKAKMIPFDKVEEYTGHTPGGVCPFGVKDGVDIYLDISLKRFDTVYPACGSSNSAIKLTIQELEKYSNYKEWIDVGKLC